MIKTEDGKKMRRKMTISFYENKKNNSIEKNYNSIYHEILPRNIARVTCKIPPVVE